MADWLVEEGIAEHRAMLIEGDRIIEARIEHSGQLAVGWVVEARLVKRAGGSARGTALADNGEEVLVAQLPRDAREGATLRLRITRAALAGPGRLKRAQGRPTDAPPAQPGLADRLATEGHRVSAVRRPTAAGWDDVIDDALVEEIAFDGGSLLLAPTAAMTTIDIDGHLPPRALALAAIPALADSLRRLDIGGSVAIDFPTLADKADRRAIDAELGEALADWPHERTAMNGFGLVQIVSRLERASILQLAAWQRPALVWHRLLRRAEGLAGSGIIELSVNSSLERIIDPAHLAALERRTGRRVRICKVATILADAPHAQLVSDV